MFVLFIRTVIIFILLEFVVRLMGKRHMGELEIGEFVTTIMISEIATIPLQDSSAPLLYAIIPVSVLMFFEIASSVILTKLPTLKRLVSPGPSILIEKGNINQDELKRLRISIEELMSVLRQNNISSIDDVYYAIMEQNASITVIPRYECQPLSFRDLNIKVEEKGIQHILITDGKIDTRNLNKLKKNKQWIETELAKQKYSIDEVLLMTIDDSDKINIIRKEKRE